MNTPRRWLSLAVVLFIAATPVLQAHPGHDGDHELTWDFAHLAAHPVATIACLATLFLGAWTVARLASAGAEILRRLRNH